MTITLPDYLTTAIQGDPIVATIAATLIAGLLAVALVKIIF